MNLVSAVWMLLSSIVLVSATPGAESPHSPLTFGYDEPVDANVSYDGPSLSSVNYDSASTLPANENDNRIVERGGIFVKFAKFVAARGVTAPFKSGEIITREFASSGGPVEMAAEAIINGRTLHLKDIAVFPKGAEKLDIGMKEVLRLRGQLADDAAGMGFDTLRITGTRLTGANPGKAVDMTIDLTRRAAGQ